MPERQVNHSSIHYTETGRGDTLVLLHGFPLDERIWREASAPLSKSCRVITLDFPGFGKSKNTKPFTMESLADDLREFLRSLGALPCVLAGLSMGGYVALAFVKKYAADLTGLILMDSRSAADTPQGRQGRNEMLEAVRKGGSGDVAKMMFPKMLNAPPDPNVAAELMDIMNNCPAQTIEYALIAMRDRPDLTESLAGIKVPALIIVGDSDVITPPDLSRSIHEKIPGSSFVMIPDSGHMTPMEQPQRVADAILKFMKS